MRQKQGVGCGVWGVGLGVGVPPYPTPFPCANRRPPRPLWRVRLALALWLLAAPPFMAGAELPQGAQVSEPAPMVDSQPLDLQSYQDPQSPLPEAGVTSQVFTALGTVLGVLALGVYLYKRVVLRGPRGANRDGTVRILGRTYLGPKESLCLVQVGTDVLLLGHTGSGITLLHTLPSSARTASPDGSVDEASIGPMEGTEHRAPSGWARERKGALEGLEGRLRRLNRLWGAGGSN